MREWLEPPTLCSRVVPGVDASSRKRLDLFILLMFIDTSYLSVLLSETGYVTANQVLTLASDWGCSLIQGWEVNAKYNPKGRGVCYE